jgi:hypothetical protein
MSNALNSLGCAARAHVVIVIAELDGTSIVVGTMQGDVWRLPVGGPTPAAGRAVAAGDAGAVLVARNHGTLSARFADGVGRGAGSGISGIGGSGVSEDTLKGVGVQLAGVCGIAYPKTVSDRFATVAHDNTVRTSALLPSSLSPPMNYRTHSSVSGSLAQVRIWDASDYTSPVHVFTKGAGHPCGVVYSLDVLLSGWEDGSLRSVHRLDFGTYPSAAQWLSFPDVSALLPLSQMPPLGNWRVVVDHCGCTPRWHVFPRPQQE